MIILAVIIVLAGLLAYSNGANDISKGVATLVGSGVTSYRRAILWGTAWTALGAIVAAAVGGAMLATFRTGLLAPGVTPSLSAAMAAVAGAVAWILIATRARLPVSTTHALVGSVVGAGLAAYGMTGIAWSGLATKVALPLAVSPVAAVVLVRLTTRGLARALGAPPASADCVCVGAAGASDANLQWMPSGSAALSAVPALTFTVARGEAAACREAQPAALRLTGDHLHWLSSGAVSFARGLNDAPKIAAFALAAMVLAPGAAPLNAAWLFALITAGIVAGSVIAGRGVTRVLAEGITPLHHRDGLAANLVTAVLVTTGSMWGLPMSTTHVSSGSIMGVGAERGAVNWSTVRGIVLAWIVTLPAAAILGIAAYGIADAVVR